MKDPSDELISALFTAINGNVSYGGNTIPVYTFPVEWEDRTFDQYIRIAEVRWGDASPKDSNICDGTIDILVDTFFTGKNEGSKKVMNSIANDMSVLIHQTFSLASFTQVQGRVMGMDDFDYELDPQGVVFRKLVTYQFITEEV
jgi:hypothetical protein